MRKNRFLIIGLLLFIGCVVIFSLATFMTHRTQNNHADTTEPNFVFTDLVVAHPDYLFVEKRLTDEKKYNELGTYFEDLAEKTPDSPAKSYLEHVATRAYVNAVVTNNQDNASLDRAIALATKIIGNDDHYGNIRAYTVDVFDRLLTPSVNDAVKHRVARDTYFKKFLDNKKPNSARAWRTRFLTFGNSLRPVTNIQVKLALLATEDLAILQKKSFPAGSENLKQDQIKAQKITIQSWMTQADNSLKQDYAGHAPFGNKAYIPRTLLNKALVAEKYARATGEMPFGDVATLYQTALSESQKLAPDSVSTIQLRYDRYLKNNPPLPH